MGRCISSSSLNKIAVQLLFFDLIILAITAISGQPLNPVQELVCENCGQGACVFSTESLLGVVCQCNPGWKQIQIGFLTFPACLVPNCTINFECGSGAPTPPPAPPPPVTPPPINITSPCNLKWCGDGDCVVNGTGCYCQCNDGSENLLDQTPLACFKQCWLGGDCNGLGSLEPPPPSPSSASRPGNNNRSNEASSCLRNLRGLLILGLSGIFLTWI